MNNKYVKVDTWVKDILRDPLDKSELDFKGDKIFSNYGTEYNNVNGVYNFKFLPCKYGTSISDWQSFQHEHESWKEDIWDNEKYEIYLKEKKLIQKSMTSYLSLEKH